MGCESTLMVNAVKTFQSRLVFVKDPM